MCGVSQRIGFYVPSEVDTGYSEVTVTDNTDGSYIDSGFQFDISTGTSSLDNTILLKTKESSEPNPVRQRYTPQTPEWIVQRLKEDQMAYAVGIL